MEFAKPSDAETYTVINTHISVAHDSSALDATDYTTSINILLHSLFSQCSVTLSGISVPSSKDVYNYRAYLETLLTYEAGVSQTHLTNLFCCPNDWDFLAHKPPSDASNREYHARWKLTNKSSEIEMYLFNVPQVILPELLLQIKCRMSKNVFYVLSSNSDSTVFFKYVDPTLQVRHVKLSQTFHLAYAKALVEC